MYISNYDFLTNMGVHLTGNDNGDNAWVNMLFFLSSNDDIEIVDPKNGKTVVFSRNDYNLGFTYDYWTDLDLAYKLRLLKWAGNDYLMSLGYIYGNVFSFRLLERSLKNRNNVKGSASSDGYIYLNLDFLENSNGFEALNTILHEVVHFNDRYNSQYILIKYLKYLPPVYNEKQLHEAIFNLPISGKIKDYESDARDAITPKMKEEILLLKNSLVSINYFEFNPKFINSEYLNSIRKFSYLYSPFEKRAREMSSKRTSEIFDKVYPNLNANPNDMYALTSALNEESFTSYLYIRIKAYTKCDLDEFINLALINEYNVLNNFETQEDFICKEDMDKFANYLEKGWNNYKKMMNKENKNNEKTDGRDML